MRIRIQTIVANPVCLSVYSGFSVNLFRALNPPGITCDIIRFDGSTAGDKVHFILYIAGIRREWKGEIIHSEITDDKIEFTDTGVVLPFPLSTWKHTHIIEKSETGCSITDDIRFTTRIVPAILLYPLLYFQFMYRRPVYQRFFGKPS